VTTVVLAAAVANRHRLGGSIWVRHSWARALQRLGFEVFLLDELRPGGAAAAFTQATDELGVAGALVDGDEVHGVDRRELVERLDGAALLVNLSGHLRDPELRRLPRVRAFVDLDPGYTQIWHAQGHDVGLRGHDHYFSVGLNVGTLSCSLPTAGIRWRPIRQPVVLEEWPVYAGDFTAFTTVGSWRGAFGPVEWGGCSYGPKAHQFRRYAALPETSGLPFEAVLAIDDADAADRRLLESGGWQLRDPGDVATTTAFAHYVSASGAEFSPAQDVYVSTSSGWFSDRTVRYLASGRPAVVQDTGLGRSLPLGEGLLTFRTPRDAAARAWDVVARYEAHREAARAIAQRFFSPEAALTPLLDATGVTP
jgi:hypothetical protein